ncbi:MAG: hypothetical protein ACPGUV_01165 [Polyangiales bacterium]
MAVPARATAQTVVGGRSYGGTASFSRQTIRGSRFGSQGAKFGGKWRVYAPSGGGSSLSNYDQAQGSSWARLAINDAKIMSKAMKLADEKRGRGDARSKDTQLQRLRQESRRTRLGAQAAPAKADVQTHALRQHRRHLSVPGIQQARPWFLAAQGTVTARERTKRTTEHRHMQRGPAPTQDAPQPWYSTHKTAPTKRPLAHKP